MAILSKGNTFADGDQVTSTKLNNLVDNAAFVAGPSGTTDDTTLEVNGSGRLQVKAIQTGNIANGAVTTAKIVDANVTKAKIENLSDYTVLGNVSGGAAAPAEVSILDEDDMASDSDTAIATQQSIKAYVDARAADPARGYNNLSHNTASGTIIENTTGRPLFVSFTLFSSNDIDYLLLDISPNSDMTGGTRIAQTRIISDGGWNSGGQVCGIIPDGWYWKVSYAGTGALSEKVHCSFAL
jgi:hypothetical protein